MRQQNKRFTQVKTARGKVYQYFRRGSVYVRLPNDPNSPEYDEAYWACMNSKQVQLPKFTFKKLVESYKKSPRWSKLAPRTKAGYASTLGYIMDRVGDMDPTKMRRSNIIEAQQNNAHRPKTANEIKKLFSILFEHAIDLDWQTHNPAKGIPNLKTGEGYAAWPEIALEKFRAKTDGTALLIFELCIGTGQRIGDVLRMRWSDFDGTGITIKQGKTGTELWVPCPPRLLALLAVAKKEAKGLTIVSNPKGQPAQYRWVNRLFGEARKVSGTQGLQVHGLRSNAASELAMAGCTDAEIAAITGHKARSMVVKYTRGARQKMLAESAGRKRDH